MGKKKDKKRRQRELETMAMWAGNSAGPMAANAGVLAGLGRMPAKQQFLVGAALGAAAAYVLADEQLRGKLLKAGMKLYASVMGGIEEMKEQAADIRAEMQADGGAAT